MKYDKHGNAVNYGDSVRVFENVTAGIDKTFIGTLVHTEIMEKFPNVPYIDVIDDDGHIWLLKSDDFERIIDDNEVKSNVVTFSELLNFVQ